MKIHSRKSLYFTFCCLLITVHAFSQKIAIINLAPTNVTIKGSTQKIFKEHNFTYSLFKIYLNEEITSATLSLKQNADTVYFVNDTALNNQLLLLPTKLYNCFATANGKMDYVLSTSRSALNSYHNQYESLVLTDSVKQQLLSALKQFEFDYLLIFSSYKIYQPNTFFTLTSEVFNSKLEKQSGIKHEYTKPISRQSPPELVKYFVRKSILSHIEVLKKRVFVK